MGWNSVTDFKKIYKFSNKWLDKFSAEDPNLQDLIDVKMAEDCLELGFSLELGHEFLRKYGNETSWVLLFFLIGDISTTGLMTKVKF